MKIMLYLNTIRHMKASQIWYQLLHRLKKRKAPLQWDNSGIERDKHISLYIPKLDSDDKYLGRFDVKEMLSGRITLLHETAEFDGTVWDYPDKAPLWNFNLHYFEYAVVLADFYSKTGDKGYSRFFEKIYLAWMRSGSKNIREPYPISLRLRNLIIAMEIYDTGLSSDFVSSVWNTIYQQYRYLEGHQERYLLGNHYFENLCTLVICSNIFNDNAGQKKYKKKLSEEMQEEILPDGIHFERSLMYHKLILEDLLRVYQSESDKTSTFAKAVRSSCVSMINSVASLEKGFNRTPLFNDSGDNVAKSVAQLRNACERIFKINIDDSITVFRNAGYYKLYDHDISVMFDAGPVGPDYIPGHAHCDCLSFELCLNGTPVFVNSGTGAYQDANRTYFRSTEAHNTATIDKHEQSECWAAHRVAGRINNITAEVNGNSIRAGYDNYLRERHERQIRLADRELTVFDSIPKTRRCASYLHLAPEITVALLGDIIELRKNNKKFAGIFPVNSEVSVLKGLYAPEFGRTSQIEVLRFYWTEDENQHGYKVKFFKGADNG